MNGYKVINARFLSIAGFSFLFAYILSSPFEGQVLYSIFHLNEVDGARYIQSAIISHFIGLFTCGLFVKSPEMAKKTMMIGMGICLIAMLPFFFEHSFLWMVGLGISGYFSGCAVASWGFFLRAFTPKNERMKSVADVLIYSNLIMIAVNMIAMNYSPVLGLSLSLLCLVIGMYFVWRMPVHKENKETKPDKTNTINHTGRRNPLILLSLFIFIVTINSGLMYQVFNPAFEHLTGLTSWYWAIPYIVALAVMRNLPVGVKRSRVIYLGIAMIIGAFLSFMLLGRNAPDYLIIDTLMLGACGIFDLFWWSILGEMLDYSDNPVKTFGIGLSANVFGVLFGGILGVGITSVGLSGAEVAVIALTIVSVTLIMLPPLNHQLVLVLKSHTYLRTYDIMNQTQQTEIIHLTKALDPLTVREQELLKLILSGKSNREIAEALYISENTVKTHVRNIFSKYDVSSRVELISTVLKYQIRDEI